MSEHKKKGKSSARDDAERLIQVRLGALEISANVREPTAEGLKELTASVREVGILDPPLVVTRGDRFVLVDGHRRVAAARAAGLTSVPVRAIEATDQEILQIQLVANLQREGLSALHEATAFKAWLDATGGTQAELARAVGKSAPYVSSRLKLLELPDKILRTVESGAISDSHAEIIARAPRQIQHALANQVTLRDVSVRQLEQDARWKAQRFKEVQAERAAFQDRVAKSKYPTCRAEVQRSLSGKGPGETPFFCERKAARPDYRGGEWVTCGLMGHAWSLKTGEVPPEPRGARSSPEPAASERVKPTLPEVSPELDLAASPADLVDYLLAGSPKIQGVVVSQQDGKRTEAFVRLEIPRVLVKDVPWFAIGVPCGGADPYQVAEVVNELGSRAKGGGIMGGCDSWDQQTDPSRKKLAETKSALEAWGAKIAGVPRGKGSTE